MRTATQTQTQTQAEAGPRAADAVAHLTRAALTRAAIEESGLRLRLCATRETAAAERWRLEQLRGQHGAEVMAAAAVLAAAEGDSPLLREAVRDRLLGEMGQARLLAAEQERLQEAEAAEEQWEHEADRLVAEERAAELRQIEADVGHLRDIVTDLSLLAGLQAEPLEQAGQLVDETKHRAAATAEELGQAERAANDARRRKLWLALGAVAVILTAGIVLLVGRKA